MKVTHITPRRFADARGWFAETWHEDRYNDVGISSHFCQDNQSFSRLAGTLRGLHFQRPPYAQAKLVRCLKGRIFDVAVDIRKTSPTFKNWVGVELTAEMGNQLFIPAGFAHGFLTLEPDCEIAYKVDAYYAPEADAGIAWNDHQIAIDWPLAGSLPLVSEKDASLPALNEAVFDFPFDGNPLLPLEG